VEYSLSDVLKWKLNTVSHQTLSLCYFRKKKSSKPIIFAISEMRFLKLVLFLYYCIVWCLFSSKLSDASHQQFIVSDHRRFFGLLIGFSERMFILRAQHNDLRCLPGTFQASSLNCSFKLIQDFDVLLIVHLSIFISVINQLDAKYFSFTIRLFHASTCFEHTCSSSGGQNCITQPLVSSHL